MSIPLHKTRGLDPHLMFCPRCGGDTNGLTIGHTIVGTLDDGRELYYMAGHRRKALEANGLDRYTHMEPRELKEGEKVPASNVCDKCETEIKNHRIIVTAGGVYWRCTECKQEGVIKKSTFADNIREAGGIEAPDPVGCEFEKCEQHATS